MRRLWRARLIQDNSGAALIESALVLPVLFAVLFGTIECGRLMWTQLALNYAVEEAARCAEVTPEVCKDNPKTAAYAQSRAEPLKLPAGAVTVSSQACGTQVAASLTYQPTLGSLVFKTAPVLKAQVCRPAP
jgi:Flp pilus assembly protein TadG